MLYNMIYEDLLVTAVEEFQTRVKEILRKIFAMTQKEIRRGPHSVLGMTVLILAVTILCVVINMAVGDTTDGKPVKRTYEINQIKLYDALRYFAFPDLDYNSNVKQRFILQVPGKMLNPNDYYPGKEYVDYLQSPQNFTKKVDIPQHVMEKVFYLVDIVPCAHPVIGETTSNSLAKLYKDVLENLDLLGFEDLDEQAKTKYNEALDKLLELVPDPDDLSKQLTLFDLYTKLQDTYYDEQQQMERKLRENRKQLEATQYQVWLERNYQVLDAQVETAYKRWLLYGRKHLTESYLAHLDISSSEKSLQKAHLALRLSRFMSHDWSQEMYPVSLSPSTWFKYLSESGNISLTREQLLAKHEDLKSRIALLENINKNCADKIEEKQLNVVQQDCNKKQENVWLKAKELEYMRKRCWLMFDSFCDIWKMEEEVTDALSESTAANFKLQMLKWKFGDNSSSKEEIEAVLMKLKNESIQLQEQIVNSTSSTLSPFVLGMKSREQLTLEEAQDQWQLFKFSSASDPQDNGLSETYNSIGSVIEFNPEPSGFPGHHTFASNIENATVFLKAKLLKVNINRPWFMESIFHDDEFKMDKKKLVSPGYMKEADFYNEVTRETPDGSPDPPYLLYQYPTAFLLAKDITIDFTGISDENKQAAILSSYSYSPKGNYGPISFGGSFTASAHQIRVSLQTNGIKVQIPGAQIIGYYCDIIPKFPSMHNLTDPES